MEFWKDIPGYEGLYQASNTGFIRSVEGKVTSSKKFKERHWKSRVLKGRGDNPITGKRVSLWKNGKPKEFLVARLVALTFLGEPPQKFTVNHKDGNRLNNSIDNLEWMSLADNIRHGFATGLYHTPKPVTLISGDKKLKFASLSKAAAYIGRNHSYISDCIKHNRPAVACDGTKYKIIRKMVGA